MTEKPDDIFEDFLLNSQRSLTNSQTVRFDARNQSRSSKLDLKRKLFDSNNKILEKIDKTIDARKQLLDAKIAVDESLLKLEKTKQNIETSSSECKRRLMILNCLIGIRRKNAFLTPSTDSILKEIQEMTEVVDNMENQFKKYSFDVRLAVSGLLGSQKEIQLELTSKRSAQTVDEDQLVQTHFSGLLSYKPSPSRMPDGANNEQQWNSNLHDMLNDADAKILVASELMKAVESFAGNKSDEISARFRRLSEMLRRVYDRLNAALRSYEDHLMKVQIEINKNQKEMEDLYITQQEYSQRLKLVESRLEHRNFDRPLLAERTSDSADTALKTERNKLIESVNNSEVNCAKLKEAIKMLNDTKLGLEKERETAQFLIDTEKSCFNELENQRDTNLLEEWRKIYNTASSLSSTSLVQDIERSRIFLID